MIVVYKCGCRREPDDWVKVRNTRSCPEHHEQMDYKLVICNNPECGIEFKIHPNNGHSDLCKDCQKARTALNVKGWHEKHPDHIEKYRGGKGDKNDEYKCAVIKTDMQPDPVVNNPYKSPCAQECSVIKKIGTYQNTACYGCNFRWEYISNIEREETPEYV